MYTENGIVCKDHVLKANEAHTFIWCITSNGSIYDKGNGDGFTDVVFDATSEEQKAFKNLMFRARKDISGEYAEVGDVVEITSGKKFSIGDKFIVRMVKIGFIGLKKERTVFLLGFNGKKYYSVKARNCTIRDIKLDYSKDTKYMEV